MVFFSITTPTYNRADKLLNVFDSLLCQTFKDFEWIIGDDGSTDNTQEIVEKMINESSFPIKYIQYEHKGKEYICCKMQEHVSGEWHAWIDSDDEFYSNNSLMEMYASIQTLPQDKMFTGVGFCFINQNNEIFPKFDEDYYDVTKQNFFDLLTKTPDCLNIYSFSQTKFDKVVEYKRDDGLEFYPEIVLIARGVLASEHYSIRVFNKPLYRYNQYNSDCVSLNHNPLVDWYQNVDMINLFLDFDLDKKYFSYIRMLINELGDGICKAKGISETINALKYKKAKYGLIYAYFIRKYLKFFILFEKYPNKFILYILGIKITKKFTKEL